MHIIYYVTGHGYGHAVRTAAICNELSKNVRITLRTMVPETFFREEVRREFSYAPASFDCGCVQKDGLHVDIQETLSSYRAIATANSGLLEREARWCVSQKADIIVSDIVPFAFDIAEKCGVTSVAATNFTWYDIYEEYARIFPGYENEVAAIKKQYGKASLLLALEPALPMGYFSKRVPVPPTGRRGRNRRADILQKYGLRPDRRLGLIYFGLFGIEGIDIGNLARFHEWEFLGICPVGGSPSNYHLVPKADFPYQDLAASADLTICKLGYGTVAEAMMHGSPLLYSPRACFAEFPVLDKAVRSWGGGSFLPLDDFTSLNWGQALEKARNDKRPEPCRSDGAKIAAQAIERAAS